ncbi:MAG: hypothetical protein ACREEM_55145, partial [Blastocatellia bacterium]
MKKPLEQIVTAIANARQETDGSINADCPICTNEGRPNERIQFYVNAGKITGASCARYARAGGGDANREHCKPVLDDLGISTDRAAFISESLFEDTLTLELEPAKLGKARIVARNCTATLARDEINLNKSSDRTQFIKSPAGFDDGQRTTINQTLLNLADRFESVQAAIEEETETETKQVIFAALPDGRLIEQIAGGQFAVYDSKARAVTYQRKVQTDAGVYEPLQDDFLLKGGLFLPEQLQEYESDAALDAEIEAAINRYCDVPVRE